MFAQNLMANSFTLKQTLNRKNLRSPMRHLKPKIVLYSHDTMGLGHMRRNILIARTLAESQLQANILLVSGAKEIGRFDLPNNVDCLTLPSYHKAVSGGYMAKHLDMEVRDLATLRAQTIKAAVSAFDPDLFIVDNVPRGTLKELEPILEVLNNKDKCRCILGLRDILDAPEITTREWREQDNVKAIEHYYEQVWIYGDPAIYDLCDAYNFGKTFRKKAKFMGYLDAKKRAAPKLGAVTRLGTETIPSGLYHLCLVGGGQDGYALAKAFVQIRHPQGVSGLLVTGPFMQPEHIAELEQLAQHSNTQVLGFVREPCLLIQQAHRVIAMGGYNTVNEVLAFQRPTLIVPRVKPRLEQWIRAKCLSDGGFIDVLHPDQLTPEALSTWLQTVAPKQHPPEINLNGLDRLADYASQLVNEAKKIRKIQ